MGVLCCVVTREVWGAGSGRGVIHHINRSFPLFQCPVSDRFNSLVATHVNSKVRLFPRVPFGTEVSRFDGQVLANIKHLDVTVAKVCKAHPIT